MGLRVCVESPRLKVCYESREQAEQAMEDYSAPGTRRAPGNARKRPRRVYPCGDHWHITSKDRIQT